MTPGIALTEVCETMPGPREVINTKEDKLQIKASVVFLPLMTTQDGRL